MQKKRDGGEGRKLDEERDEAPDDDIDQAAAGRQRCGERDGQCDERADEDASRRDIVLGDELAFVERRDLDVAECAYDEQGERGRKMPDEDGQTALQPAEDQADAGVHDGRAP